MLFRNVILSFLLLVGQSLLVAAARHMNVEGEGNFKTWYQTGKLESHQDFSVETLEGLAKDFYDYVINQANSRTSNNACIVAVLGDRQTRRSPHRL